VATITAPVLVRPRSKSTIPVAIVHDYLSQFGGAERVVLRMASLFPDAPIFTAFYSPEDTYDGFRTATVQTSPLQGRVRPDRFRRSVLRYPAAFRHFDLSRVEKVIVSSSAFAHYIRHPRSLVYCYTPPRYLHDTAAYIHEPHLASAARLAMAPLRHRDRVAAKHHLAYLACSRATAERVRSAYGMSVPVVYPPLETAHLPAVAEPMPERTAALMVARLIPYKRVDLAISACGLAGVPLTVVGEGPDLPRLQALAAGAAVTFTGRVGDGQLADLMSSHSMMLAPGREDFGYAPVEANYAGRPALALAAGGGLETLIDGVTGRLVCGESPDVWAQAIDEVAGRSWSPPELRRHSQRFSGETFDAAITSHLTRL